MTDAPVLFSPGEGEEINERLRIKCGREELVLTETTGSASTVPHVHDHHADAFWLIEGDFSVRLGDEEVALEPGDFALVPPGMVHRFQAEGARWLNFHAPGAGFAEYLRSGADFDDRNVPEDTASPDGGGRASPPGRGRAPRPGSGGRCLDQGR